jgi:hypothetical protein
VRKALPYVPVLAALLILLPGEIGAGMGMLGVPLPARVMTALQPIRLGARDFWGDEIGTVLAAREPLDRIITGQALDFHPPLYYVLVHFWMKLVGCGEAAVRVPSVLFALGTVALLSRLGAAAGGSRVARWVPTLGAFYPVLVMFSRMARYYSLVALLATLSCLLFWRVFRDGARRHVIGYVAAALALAYTNYLSICLVAAQLVVALVWGGRRRFWLSVCLGLVLGYAPWIGVALSQAGMLASRAEIATPVSGVGGMIVRGVYPLYVLALGETLFPWRYTIVAPGLLLVGVTGIAGLRCSRRLRLGAGTMVAGALALGVLVACTVARTVPPAYLPSRMLFLAPTVLVLIALGVTCLGRRGWIIGAALVFVWFCSILNYYRGQDFHNPVYLIPWKEIVLHLRSSIRHTDAVVSTPEYPFLFYKGDDMEVTLLDTHNFASVQTELRSSDCPRLWVLSRERADPTVASALRPFWQWLKHRYRRIKTYNYVVEDARSVRLKKTLLGRPVSASKVSLALYVLREG